MKNKHFLSPKIKMFSFKTRESLLIDALNKVLTLKLKLDNPIMFVSKTHYYMALDIFHMGFNYENV